MYTIQTLAEYSTELVRKRQHSILCESGADQLVKIQTNEYIMNTNEASTLFANVARGALGEGGKSSATSLSHLRR